MNGNKEKTPTSDGLLEALRKEISGIIKEKPESLRLPHDDEKDDDWPRFSPAIDDNYLVEEALKELEKASGDAGTVPKKPKEAPLAAKEAKPSKTLKPPAKGVALKPLPKFPPRKGQIAQKPKAPVVPRPKPIAKPKETKEDKDKRISTLQGTSRIKKKEASIAEIKERMEREQEIADCLQASARLSLIPPPVLERLFDTEHARSSAFIESNVSKSIDEDLMKMRLDLDRSYELFQSTGEKLENINFSGLKQRIKDVRLTAGQDASTRRRNDELRLMFEQSYRDNKLKKLTEEQMKKSFRQHPGEFADIPELSTFFQTCSQLEHELGSLRRQRNEVNDLTKRMNWAMDVSFGRIDEIMGATLGRATPNDKKAEKK